MYCQSCGNKILDNVQYCGNCGSRVIPEESTQGGTPQPQGYTEAPQYATPVGQAQTGPTNLAYYNLKPRDFWMWFILGICTCGIGSLVYLYYNFDDMRKLERVLQQKTNTPQYITTTTDPIIGMIMLFVCSPVTTILKYNSMNDLITTYYPSQYNTPRPASVAKLIGIWVGTFLALFVGFIFPPLLLLVIILPFYQIYLEYEWQNVMNHYIRTNMS